MPSKTIRFTSVEWLPKRGDCDELFVVYSIVDSRLVNTLDEVAKMERKTVTVRVTRSRLRTWPFQPDELKKVLWKFAVLHIQDRLRQGKCGEHEFLILDTKSAPDECPFDPASIEISLNEPITIDITRPVGFVPQR